MSLDSSAYVCPSERRPLAAMPTALARCCYGKVAGPPSRAGALPARRRQFAASARTDGYLLTCVVVRAIDGVPVNIRPRDVASSLLGGWSIGLVPQRQVANLERKGYSTMQRSISKKKFLAAGTS